MKYDNTNTNNNNNNNNNHKQINKLSNYAYLDSVNITKIRSWIHVLKKITN